MATGDTPPGLNPRGKKLERPPSKVKLGSPLLWIALAVLGFLLFRSYFSDAGVRRVAYSDFRKAVAQGKFAHVQIGSDWVKGFPAPEIGSKPSAPSKAPQPTFATG
ncbi:MAG: ATP-dependent metallopeptidase FtsH/Yme1/Tma family protein, partial [Deltaproteobacteria bacterium]